MRWFFLRIWLQKKHIFDEIPLIFPGGEGRFSFQLSNDANALLDRVSELFCFVGRCVLLGDLPCCILESILKHGEQFMKMLCTCGEFSVQPGCVFMDTWPVRERSMR